MEDDNTTVQPVADTGAENALPVVQNDVQSADAQTVTEPSEPSQDATTAESSAPTVDDKLKKYAESNGIELDSPGAIKAAQIGLKAQSEATKNYQRTQELERATNIAPEQLPTDVSPQQQENVRIRNLELQIGVQSWKAQNPDKLELEAQMVEVLSDPNKKLLVQEGYLSLDDVYHLAKAKAPDNSAEIRSQAKQETLQSLAHKQTAAVPTGNATTQGGPQEKPFADLSISEMEKKLGFGVR